MTKDELKRLSSVSIYQCDAKSLADLCEISVDGALSVGEKMDSFFQQIGNPYLFKVGDVVMKIEFGGESNFSDAVEGIIRNYYH